jgi:archaemetzincin
LFLIKVVNNCNLDGEVIAELEAGLIEALPGSRITFEKQLFNPPNNCFNSGRRQYNSTLLLSFAKTSFAKMLEEKVLLIESVDLYAGNLNFVFGEADPNTGFAIVSTYRLIPKFYGENSQKLFISRLLKEAIHELGHLFWLGHCRDSACVMSFSNSILDTDRKSQRFCEECTVKLILYSLKRISLEGSSAAIS